MANQLPDFEGKVAIVTGAGSGIGEAVAREIAARGGSVVVADVNQAAAERVAKALNAEGGTAKAIRTDVADPAAVETMVQFAVEAFGGLDVAINNAGIGGPLAPTGDYPLDGWRKVIDVNLNGVFYGMRYQIPAMLARGGGAIVNVASISGWIAQPNRWTYNATKGAILALTRCQALDLARDGIRVNSVSPGTIWTPELDRMAGGDRAKWEPTFAPHHILNRVGESGEVAAAIVFLCSDAASFITGEDLRVDGGYLAMGHDKPEGAIEYTKQ
jgi:NAD(P)-dependent dehydrogenase (short-subunit alcohol dehydrogenase family)